MIREVVNQVKLLDVSEVGRGEGFLRLVPLKL